VLVRAARIGLLLTSCVLVQTMVLPEVRVFHAAPDLVLVAVIAIAYHSDPETGATSGFVGGFLMDLFLRTPLGVSAIAFALVGYAVGALRSGVLHATRWMPFMLGGVGGLIGGSVYLALSALSGQEGLITGRSLTVLVVSALLDAAIAVVVFPIVRRALADPELAGVR
jgi:rod shape-determining protein MreD